jgi:hypothetical protein
MLSHVVVRQRLGACTRSFLPRLQDDHFARTVFELTFPVMGKHPFLQGVRYRLYVFAAFITDHPEGAKPDLWVDSY